ncbi:hypothetical protein ACL2XP_17125 [Sodalis sp. RH21]|uniref:hypothetical protein n=1 Tax=unclassified Sodalis (in: enterobacteria) TaxID=2636512 RepID=UPI0039B5C999
MLARFGCLRNVIITKANFSAPAHISPNLRILPTISAHFTARCRLMVLAHGGLTPYQPVYPAYVFRSPSPAACAKKKAQKIHGRHAFLKANTALGNFERPVTMTGADGGHDRIENKGGDDVY